MDNLANDCVFSPTCLVLFVYALRNLDSYEFIMGRDKRCSYYNDRPFNLQRKGWTLQESRSDFLFYFYCFIIIK